MKNDTAPPLGIMPQRLWKERRFQDLVECMHRYVDADLSLPSEIAEEYAQLMKELYQPKGNRTFIREDEWSLPYIALTLDGSLEVFTKAKSVLGEFRISHPVFSGVTACRIWLDGDEEALVDSFEDAKEYIEQYGRERLKKD
jgi:hypothetical protein